VVTKVRDLAPAHAGLVLFPRRHALKYEAARGRVLPHVAIRGPLGPQRSVGRVIIHDGPVAPWRQIYALLREQIDSGELPPGSRLPSIVDLAQTYEVALTTVRKALDRLKADGLVVTSPMGTYVAEG
jgi:Bacterial regulatory proteins, gntR family